MATQLVRYAQDCARTLLADDYPEQWERSRRAAAQAATVVEVLDRPRGEIMVAAAWLHAVGHARTVITSGCVPIDGAIHLLAEGWPTPVVNLVAHQGQARLLAAAYGDVERLALFDRIQGWPSDILDYAVTMGLPPEGTTDPEVGLRLAAKQVPASLAITARDRSMRERRLRRAVDRVHAALIAARSPAHQGA